MSVVPVLVHVGAALATERTEVVLDPVVVTATRQEQRSFDLPASIDIIGREAIAQGQPMVNLSETLLRVPGIVALNRQNYAQDLQISSRGFGARAAFGVRGVRLYQDDIPATMPDGQGQTGSFQLLTAERIEVLRGPFSTLYGNASGGVVAVFTESGTPVPEIDVTAGGGSFDSWTIGTKLRGSAGALRYVLAGTHFSTGGFRDHSSARRTLGAGKLTMSLGERTELTLLGTSQSQPESEDPLGLTRSQWEEDPRQTHPLATIFDTRKTVRQEQIGARLQHAFSGTSTLRLTGYGGQRRVRQFLAFAGDAPTSSGGVTDLDRTYAGASIKWLQRGHLLDGPLTLTIGLDHDRQDERRRGYVNDAGRLGELRRDEDDLVFNTDLYAQVEWRFHPRAALTAGVRSSRVRFRSDDHFVTQDNPDDSGRTRFRKTTPVIGLSFSASDAVNLYATYGEGFETPTFAELAYRPGGPGLNFDLRASGSRAAEIGVKALTDRQRFTAALFAIDTDDEIVVDAATGGRTTFRNAGKTQRRGVELGWEASLGREFTALATYSYLRAEYAQAFASGSPAVVVPAGNRLPGVPAQTAYAELAWSPATFPGFFAALEARHVGRILINDRNSDAAPSYSIANLRFGVEKQWERTRLVVFARIDNLADRNYVGSVIVGDTNGRSFEPAPGRHYFVGATLNVTL